MGVGAELVGGTPAVVEGDFFRAGDEQSLALLDGFHKIGGLSKGAVRTGVQPGKASAQSSQVQAALSQVIVVDTGDFQLSPGRGTYVGGYLHHVVGIEIQPGDGQVGAGYCGFSSMETGMPWASASTTP